MVKTFIVTKEFLTFELHIDGKVQVRPLPECSFSTQTITVFAEVYQSVIEWRQMADNNQDLEETAVRYFESKGFEVKQKNTER